jgi:hypothetical protein
MFSFKDLVNRLGGQVQGYEFRRTNLDPSGRMIDGFRWAICESRPFSRQLRTNRRASDKGMARRMTETRSDLPFSRVSFVREFEQEMDEFGLTMGSGLFKNAGELGAGGGDRNTAPPRRRRAAVALEDLGGEPGFGAGQAKTLVQILRKLTPAGFGINHRHNSRRRAQS